MNTAEHLRKALEHLQAMQDENTETDSDGDTYVIDDLYQPSISDLELNEHQGKDRPVVYLDEAKAFYAPTLTLEQVLGCLPKHYAVDGSNWHISPDYHRAYNQAIDDTTAALRKLAGGRES